MPQPTDPKPSKPGGSRQQSAGQPEAGRGQQKQEIPEKDLLGPQGDPAEGKPEIGPQPKPSASGDRERDRDWGK